MNSKLNTKEVIMSALLCAIGIMIPMISPIKMKSCRSIFFFLKKNIIIN